jgi:two-component system sensor histidine kinase UhpB
VQEALQNTVKHGCTGKAAVEICCTAKMIRLRVTDNGIGFDPLKVKDGLGLVSMRERLYLVGGDIDVDSRPSGGTRIRVRVPIPPSGQHGNQWEHAETCDTIPQDAVVAR